MTVNHKDLSIPWPLMPDHVSSNTDRGLLHLIAMLTMVIDHVGVVIFPRISVLRYIGRMAMPIFAYCTACGCVYTRSPLRYLRRLVLLALITQPIYAFTMNHTVRDMYAIPFAENPVSAVINFCVKSWMGHPSILLSLILGLMICWTLRERQIVFTVALAVFVWLMQRRLDYGWKGVALIVLFYVCCQKTWISLPCVLIFMIWWGMQNGTIEMFGLKFNMQIFALPALIPIYVHTDTRICIPRVVYYMFYPLHMIAIYLLENYVI